MINEFPKIYIVRGNTGEYDASTTWDFRAYTDKNQAQEQCNKLNSLLIKNKLSLSDFSWDDEHYEAEDIMKEFDPNFRCWDCGTEYFVSTVDMDGF